MPTIRIDPTLIELVINSALEESERSADAWLGREYHALADPLYAKLAIQDREGAFDAIAVTLFAKLGWDTLIANTYAEFPDLAARAPDLLVLGALRESEEGAVIGRDGKSVCLRVRLQRFRDRGRLAAFLRHEVQHADDMLDPEFGYALTREPSLGESNRVADRYRAFWCAYVDARLARRGFVPLADAVTHRNDLYSHFANLTVRECDAQFDQVWNRERLTHAEILRWAREKSNEERDAVGPKPGSFCPLCRFPTHAWVTEFEPAVADLIRIDFPTWFVHDGACERCAERYALNLSDATFVGANL